MDVTFSSITNEKAFKLRYLEAFFIVKVGSLRALRGTKRRRTAQKSGKTSGIKLVMWVITLNPCA